MSDLILTEGQQAAYGKFISFIMDPAQEVFVLKGYAGTGKSTLVNVLLEELPETLKTAKLLTGKDIEWQVELTATTNKAAEALSSITHLPVSTIHSFLGLRIHKDYDTGKTSLRPKRASDVKSGRILFIDEASYVDSDLLKLIFSQTHNCKIIFIGDPAQLAPVKSSRTPVFDASFPEASLDEVVRQAEGNPIIDLATMFRNTVNSGIFNTFRPDQNSIIHLPRNDFDQAIVDEFTRPDWEHNDSKVLAWTNKCVIRYNNGIRELVEGTPEFRTGDYAICNSFVSNSNGSIKTDQLVQITSISSATELEVPGWRVTLDGKMHLFLPEQRDALQQLKRKAKKDKDAHLMKYIDDTFVDLRAAYACTINKSQGSTYKRAYIDLSDIGRCNSANQIARMLYVAVSRASETIYLTGDLV